MKYNFLFLVFFFINSNFIWGQKSCSCDSIAKVDCPKEIVQEKIMIRPVCPQTGKAIYLLVEKKVLKHFCDPRVYTYPCDCEEKRRNELEAEKNRFLQKASISEYQEITIKDCNGNPISYKLLKNWIIINLEER